MIEEAVTVNALSKETYRSSSSGSVRTSPALLVFVAVNVLLLEV